MALRHVLPLLGMSDPLTATLEIKVEQRTYAYIVGTIEIRQAFSRVRGRLCQLP